MHEQGDPTLAPPAGPRPPAKPCHSPPAPPPDLAFPSGLEHVSEVSREGPLEHRLNNPPPPVTGGLPDVLHKVGHLIDPIFRIGREVVAKWS